MATPTYNSVRYEIEQLKANSAFGTVSSGAYNKKLATLQAQLKKLTPSAKRTTLADTRSLQLAKMDLKKYQAIAHAAPSDTDPKFVNAMAMIRKLTSTISKADAVTSVANTLESDYRTYADAQKVAASSSKTAMDAAKQTAIDAALGKAPAPGAPGAEAIGDTGKSKNPFLTDYTIKPDGNGHSAVYYTSPMLDDKGVPLLETDGVTPKTKEAQVYLVDDGTGKFAHYESGLDAAKAIIKSFPGGAVSLKQSLLKSGWINQAEFNHDDYIGGLISSISSHSVSSVWDWQTRAVSPNAKDAFKQTYNQFLTSGKAGSGVSTGPQTDTTNSLQSTRRMTDKTLNEAMQTLGLTATPQQQDAYYTEVRKAENALSYKQVTSKDAKGNTVLTPSGEVLSDADRVLMATRIASTSLKAAGADAKTLDKVLKSSSTAATGINQIMAKAREYNITLTSQQALDYVVKSLEPGNSMANQMLRLESVASSFYKDSNPTMSAHIAKGGTYKDISDLYANIYTKKLGTVIPDSVDNPEIKNAISTNMNEYDFDRSLQKNKEWKLTPEAHNIADSYLSRILSSFGFGGN